MWSKEDLVMVEGEWSYKGERMFALWKEGEPTLYVGERGTILFSDGVVGGAPSSERFDSVMRDSNKIIAFDTKGNLWVLECGSWRKD